MSETNDSPILPKSPFEEVGGIPYFVRMCDKIRLDAAGKLSADYQSNLGGGFDKWACEYLGVDYADLVAKVQSGLDDVAALAWAQSAGVARSAVEREWWICYMRNRGCRDDIGELFLKRKSEYGFGDRADIMSFFDLIDADEGRN
ncbi:MAG: DUF5069 domain-containing protein [Akkermansiaceae bacterium]